MEVGDRVDRYMIERVLGEGGMATVYLARHDTLRSLHALKVLRIDVPTIKKRLLTEGRVQAALRHPNVVSVTDVIDRKGICALVLEYVDGPPLDAWIDDPDIPLVLEERLEIFKGIALGVAAAHQAGLVHRDLKPDNILLARTNTGFVPKVTDFGLVKVEASGHTQSGVLMGTAEYMAPEQIRDAASVEESADVWSLGVILYELVSDSQPFHADDIIDVYNLISKGEYEPVQLRNPDVPDEVVEVVDRLLVLDPDRRPSAEWIVARLFPEHRMVAHRPAIDRADLLAEAPRQNQDELTPHEISSIIEATLAIPRPRPWWRSGPAIALLGGGLLGVLAFGLLGLLLVLRFGGRPTQDRQVTLTAPVALTQLEIDGRAVPYNRNTAALQLSPGAHVVWAEAGACSAADKGCGDACPPGCASVVMELDVVASERPLQLPLALELGAPVPPTPSDTDTIAPAPAEPVAPEPAAAPEPAPVPTPVPAAPAPQPAPAPASAAPTAAASVVSAAAYATWLASNPEWAAEAAQQSGRADVRYLRDWNPDPPAGALTQVPWAAAAAYCASRGGLAPLDAAPLTWKPGVVQEWRIADGKPAWRRSDGVTSTANPGNKSFSFTGVRCRR